MMNMIDTRGEDFTPDRVRFLLPALIFAMLGLIATYIYMTDSIENLEGLVTPPERIVKEIATLVLLSI